VTDEYETYVKGHWEWHPDDRLCRCGKDVEPGKAECFRCRVSTVGFAFVGGGGYGRSAFTERTNAEWLNENVGDVKQKLKDGTIAPKGDY
jgi:hypothetical protein